MIVIRVTARILMAYAQLQASVLSEQQAPTTLTVMEQGTPSYLVLPCKAFKVSIWEEEKQDLFMA